MKDLEVDSYCNCHAAGLKIISEAAEVGVKLYSTELFLSILYSIRCPIDNSTHILVSFRIL